MKRFDVAGPLTAHLRCPVAVRTRGTGRVPVAADRRCWRPEMAVAGTQIEVGLWWAVPTNRASAYGTPLDGATVKVVITTVNKT